VFGDLAFWVGFEGNLLYVWGRVEEEEEEEGFGRCRRLLSIAYSSQDLFAMLLVASFRYS
jgi:hypothetical protein